MISEGEFIMAQIPRNEFDPLRFFLWVLAMIIIYPVFFLVVFLLSGFGMALFQFPDAQVLLVYKYFSFPVSIVLFIWFVVKRRELIKQFIEAGLMR